MVPMVSALERFYVACFKFDLLFLQKYGKGLGDFCLGRGLFTEMENRNKKEWDMIWINPLFYSIFLDSSRKNGCRRHSHASLL